MKKVFMLLIVLVFGLCLPVFTFAEILEGNPLLPNFLMPGMIESTGTHFEVTNSEYLNIVLDSSETITMRLESVPEMVTMHIEAASDAILTQITIGEFQPSTTYYKYEDDYHNEEIFTTDEDSRYTYTQDISNAHLVFIQPRGSTKFIKDDATGGDCTSIGTWDSTTKTCTLTTDVYETIQIDSDYITLDGNGHAITGTGTGNGVYLYGRTGVTIKNLNVTKFSHGILLWYSSNNTLTGNIASNNSPGIGLLYSSNNTLTSNTALNNEHGISLGYSSNNTLISNNAVSNAVIGIQLYYSSNNALIYNSVLNNSYYGINLYLSRNNTLTDNTAQENYLLDLYVGAYSDSDCNNVIQNTTGSGGRPINYFSSSVNIENETLSELILCNADYSNINNVTIKGSETLLNNGLFVIRTDYSNITNTNSSNNWIGICLDYSSNNTLTGNTTSNNLFGISLGYYSSNNTLTGNTASNNLFAIYLGYYSSNNTLTGNTVCNNTRYDFYCLFSSILAESNNMCDRVYGCQISCTPCREAPVDTTPPAITVTATPNILWPPNHKMVDVRIDGSAIDKESGIASVVITVKDEYEIYNMTVPQFGSIIQLEAWRKGTDKDGRVYTITVIATDMAGN